MKKLFAFMSVVALLAVAACKKADAVPTSGNDSISVDSVKADSVAVDSAKVDSLL